MGHARRRRLPWSASAAARSAFSKGDRTGVRPDEGRVPPLRAGADMLEQLRGARSSGASGRRHRGRSRRCRDSARGPLFSLTYTDGAGILRQRRSRERPDPHRPRAQLRHRHQRHRPFRGSTRGCSCRRRPLFLSDAGSRFGTQVNGAPVEGERELAARRHLHHRPDRVHARAGRRRARAAVRRAPAARGLGNARCVRVDAIRRPTQDSDRPPKDPSGREPQPAHRSREPPESAGGRRRRAGGPRRPCRERRPAAIAGSGRFLRLLSEIAKTLVTVQPLAQMLARVVDLVFEVVPAERAFLLLRDSPDEPLTARVMRIATASCPTNVRSAAPSSTTS